jgi:hypothetical protein
MAKSSSMRTCAAAAPASTARADNVSAKLCLVRTASTPFSGTTVVAHSTANCAADDRTPDSNTLDDGGAPDLLSSMFRPPGRLPARPRGANMILARAGHAPSRARGRP